MAGKNKAPFAVCTTGAADTEGGTVTCDFFSYMHKWYGW